MSASRDVRALQRSRSSAPESQTSLMSSARPSHVPEYAFARNSHEYALLSDCGAYHDGAVVFPHLPSQSLSSLACLDDVVSITHSGSAARKCNRKSAENDELVVARISENLFRAEDSPLVPYLQYETAVVSFNLYPATPRDVRMNKLLHSAARTGEIDACVANPLANTNVLSFVFPPLLSKALAEVTWEEFEDAQLEILALIAEDYDEEALNQMKSELETSVSNLFEDYMEKRLVPVTRKYPKLSLILETLLVSCYRTPWKIDICCLHVHPLDLYYVLARTTERNLTPMVSREHSDLVVSRTVGRRPSLRDSISPSRMSVRSSWTVYVSWPSFYSAVVVHLGRDVKFAANLFNSAHAAGTYQQAQDTADFVRCASSRNSQQGLNIFMQLPRDVIETKLVPFVLLAGCSA